MVVRSWRSTCIAVEWRCNGGGMVAEWSRNCVGIRQAPAWWCNGGGVVVGFVKLLHGGVMVMVVECNAIVLESLWDCGEIAIELLRNGGKMVGLSRCLVPVDLVVEQPRKISSTPVRAHARQKGEDAVREVDALHAREPAARRRYLPPPSDLSVVRSMDDERLDPASRFPREALAFPGQIRLAVFSRDARPAPPSALDSWTWNHGSSQHSYSKGAEGTRNVSSREPWGNASPRETTHRRGGGANDAAMGEVGEAGRDEVLVPVVVQRHEWHGRDLVGEHGVAAEVPSAAWQI
eukprot:gene11457-biopygen8965